MKDDRFELVPGEELEKLQENGLSVLQKADGGRFSMDSVLLSHFASVRPGDRAADLGCGCGVISLLLCAREERLQVDALELDARMADMARRSAAGNGLEKRLRVLNGDIRSLPKDMPAGGYDLVVSNPPYGGRPGTAPERALERTEAGCTPADAVAAAKRLLRFGGRFALCWPAGRLQTMLALLDQARFSVKRLRMVHALPDRNAYLCLMEAVFGGKEGLIVQPPLYARDENGLETDEIREIYGS